MKLICKSLGVEGVAPIDGQEAGEGQGPDALRRIVQADMRAMDRVDGGVFCVDPFRRSPEMDPGTAFELGYMRALGRPVAGWTADANPYPRKVSVYFAGAWGLDLTPCGENAEGGTSGLERDPDGVLVHSTGCLQNGMVDYGIETGGGACYAHGDWRIAFHRACRDVADRLLGRPRPARDMRWAP